MNDAAIDIETTTTRASSYRSGRPRLWLVREESRAGLLVGEHGAGTGKPGGLPMAPSDGTAERAADEPETVEDWKRVRQRIAELGAARARHERELCRSLRSRFGVPTRASRASPLHALAARCSAHHPVRGTPSPDPLGCLVHRWQRHGWLPLHPRRRHPLWTATPPRRPGPRRARLWHAAPPRVQAEPRSRAGRRGGAGRGSRHAGAVRERRAAGFVGGARRSDAQPIGWAPPHLSPMAAPSAEQRTEERSGGGVLGLE